jgi:hypothetical protein
MYPPAGHPLGEHIWQAAMVDALALVIGPSSPALSSPSAVGASAAGAAAGAGQDLFALQTAQDPAKRVRDKIPKSSYFPNFNCLRVVALPESSLRILTQNARSTGSNSRERKNPLSLREPASGAVPRTLQ